MINPISGGSGFYMNNPYGGLQSHQLIHNQSYEDTDLFIQLFRQAIDNGLDPNSPQVQEEIFSRGILGGYDQLMPQDQKRLTRAVEALYQAR